MATVTVSQTSSAPRPVSRHYYEQLRDKAAMFNALDAAVSDGRAVIVDDQESAPAA